MARRYISKTPNRRFLDIWPNPNDRFYVGWFDPSHDEFSYVIGQRILPAEMPQETAAREDWIAYFVIAPFSEGRDEHGFWFENGPRARRAMTAANSTLLDTCIKRKDSSEVKYSEAQLAMMNAEATLVCLTAILSPEHTPEGVVPQGRVFTALGLAIKALQEVRNAIEKSDTPPRIPGGPRRSSDRCSAARVRSRRKP